MANRWGNNGNSDRLYFWGSKITADGDCSHEIKRCLLLGRKSMTNLDSILKSRDITLLTKVCLFKALVFYSSHVSVWELDHKEGWTPKNWWCWRRLLKSPLDCKEIQPVNPKIRKSGSFNTLATWCEELTHWKRPWCYKRLKPGGEGHDRRRDGWMASVTQWTWI